MKKTLLGLLSLILVCACAHDANVISSQSLLPVPQDMQTAKGCFTVGNGTKFYINTPADDKDAITNAFAAWNNLLEATENNAATN